MVQNHQLFGEIFPFLGPFSKSMQQGLKTGDEVQNEHKFCKLFIKLP